MKYFRFFLKAILAGIFIAIGGTVYLSCENKVIGSVLFSLGLFTIVNWGLNLYTGKIGYLDKTNYLEVIITFFGNFVGTNLAALAIKGTRIYPALTDKIATAKIVEAKLADSYLSLFILAIFCGMLMYTAVATFKKRSDILGAIAVIMCVSVFILCGFEHCIANMFYFALGTPIKEYILPLIIMTLGNSIGGIVLHRVYTFSSAESK